MKEDYAEKVIELLCDEIDSLKKEIGDLKKRPPVVTGTINWMNSDGTWTKPTVTHTIVYDRYGSYPCHCGCSG